MIINLRTETAMLVNDILERQYGIPKKSVFNPDYCNFESTDLERIESLDIVNFVSISDLQYFPNLKRLHLRGKSYNDILPEFHYDECSIINHITDFSPLSSLVNLEELVIENDLHIKGLDLTNLKRLRTLIIVNNPLLKEVRGLDELEGLTDIIMYGNAITTPINIDAYVHNTRLTNTNILDLGMYLPMIGYNREGAKRLKDLEIAGISKVRFAEKSGFLSFTKVDPQNLYDMYVKLDTMFKRSKAYDLSDEDKVNYVFTYLLRNISFSKELIEKRDTEYNAAIAKYQQVPEQLKSSLASIHSGYRTYYFKTGNCEGLVNLMVFMLKMLGLEAYDVHCHDRRSRNSLGSNHAVVRVHLNGQICYCDPSYDRKNAFKYLLVDYETISKYHEFDSFEHQLGIQNKKDDNYVI